MAQGHHAASKEELIEQLNKLEQENALLKQTLQKSSTERELAQDKFRMLFEHSPVGMALVNHQTGAFLEVNNSVLRSTGYTKDEFLALSYWEITPREYEAQEMQQLNTLNETGWFGPNFKEYIRKDGSRYPLSISGALFIDTDGTKVVWGIIEDLSERKEAEHIITRQYAELLQLNADKDRFISILAHDLKSPFSSLLGFSDMLINDLHNRDITGIGDMLQIINSTAHRTYELLEDLLLWARSSSGKFSFEPQLFNFIATCNEVARLFEGQAREKNITIQCVGDAAIFLNCDLYAFKTLLRNLILNAIKFSHSNGRIVIAIEMDALNAIISVSDNGIGIDDDARRKLWEINENYSTFGTNNEKGAGFGLKLCKELVEKQGGSIWVESEKQKGSVFRFSLPIVPR